MQAILLRSTIHPMDTAVAPKKFFNTRNTIIALVVLVILLGAGFAYFFFKATGNTDTQSKAEAEEVIRKVGRLMVLPDETPTVATVSDPEKLRDQQFFNQAVAGDKVLIYSGAQKAILYSPKLDKIVEVAPVNLGTGQQ